MTQPMPIIIENPPSSRGQIALSPCEFAVPLPPRGVNSTPQQRQAAFKRAIRHSYGNNLYHLVAMDQYGSLVGEAAGSAMWARIRYANRLFPTDLARHLLAEELHMPIDPKARHRRSRKDQRRKAAYDLAILLNKTAAALIQ